MDLARISVAGCAAAVVIGAGGTGCGKDHKNAEPSSTTSSGAATSSTGPLVTGPPPGQPPDYSALLIRAGDIGADFTTPQPPVLNPNNAVGVAQLFANSDKSRRIWDTISIVADPAAAAAGLDSTKSGYAGKVNGTWQPVGVGSNGAMISGTSPDNSQAVTVLLFTEGRTAVTLEFDSAANDPVDAGVATDIGRQQDTAIKRAFTS